MTAEASAGWTALIILHTLAAAAAGVVGTWLLVGRKGSSSHRLLGRTWLVLMATVGFSSFGIYKTSFSWIHGLSLLMLVMLVRGLMYARQHKVQQHKKTMMGIYFGALLLTGLFTLLPGRLIGKALMTVLR